MAVIRINKTGDYSVISNLHFREKKMSLKAKGLLSMMLSLPDNWGYSIAGLVALSKDGRDSIMNALKELEQFGYLKRTRVTDEKGKFAGYDYDIFESPQTDFPYSENPNSENQQLLNTKLLNTNNISLKKEKKERKKICFSEIIRSYTDDEQTIDLLQEWLNVRKAKRAAMTERAIKLNLDKLDNLAKQSGLTIAQYLTEVICRGWAAFYPITCFKSNTVQSDGKWDDFEAKALKSNNNDII